MAAQPILQPPGRYHLYVSWAFRGNYHMAMSDYEFVVVQPLKKGRHTFYVINRGSQTHQLASLVRLDPGVSAQDLLSAFELHGPRSLPGKLIGGISGLEPEVTERSPLSLHQVTTPSSVCSPIPPLVIRMPPKAWS
jgi:hypothetical protein